MDKHGQRQSKFSPKTWLTLGALSLVAVGATIALGFKSSSAPYSRQTLAEVSGQTSSDQKSKRELRNAVGNHTPPQLRKFLDGLMSQAFDPKKLSRTLSTIPSITLKQANAILDEAGEDRVANYLGGLPTELRNNEANNQVLYLLLVNRLIDTFPSPRIDLIKKMGPPALFSGQYSNLLTKAALEPTGQLATQISDDLLPYNSWLINIDGTLFKNLLDSGLGIKAVIERLESLPGGKDLAAAAVIEHYLYDDTPVDFESPDGRDLLAYINHSDRMTLHSVAIIEKLTKAANGKSAPNSGQGTTAPDQDKSK